MKLLICFALVAVLAGSAFAGPSWYRYSDDDDYNSYRGYGHYRHLGYRNNYYLPRSYGSYYRRSYYSPWRNYDDDYYGYGGYRRGYGGHRRGYGGYYRNHYSHSPYSLHGRYHSYDDIYD